MGVAAERLRAANVAQIIVFGRSRLGGSSVMMGNAELIDRWAWRAIAGLLTRD